jgi:hypothetical protein
MGGGAALVAPCRMAAEYRHRAAVPSSLAPTGREFEAVAVVAERFEQKFHSRMVNAGCVKVRA